MGDGIKAGLIGTACGFVLAGLSAGMLVVASLAVHMSEVDTSVYDLPTHPPIFQRGDSAILTSDIPRIRSEVYDVVVWDIKPDREGDWTYSVTWSDGVEAKGYDAKPHELRRLPVRDRPVEPVEAAHRVGDVVWYHALPEFGGWVLAEVVMVEPVNGADGGEILYSIEWDGPSRRMGACVPAEKIHRDMPRIVKAERGLK